MRKIIALALVLLPVDAVAADLAGRWRIARPDVPGFEAVFLVDQQRRATVESPLDGDRPAKFLGYVHYSDSTRTEFVMTNRSDVVHIDCLVETKDVMHCRTRWADGRSSKMYSLTRVGPAPFALLAPH